MRHFLPTDAVFVRRLNTQVTSDITRHIYESGREYFSCKIKRKESRTIKPVVRLDRLQLNQIDTGTKRG